MNVTQFGNMDDISFLRWTRPKHIAKFYAWLIFIRRPSTCSLGNLQICRVLSSLSIYRQNMSQARFPWKKKYIYIILYLWLWLKNTLICGFLAVTSLLDKYIIIGEHHDLMDDCKDTCIWPPSPHCILFDSYMVSCLAGYCFHKTREPTAKIAKFCSRIRRV